MVKTAFHRWGLVTFCRTICKILKKYTEFFLKLCWIMLKMCIAWPWLDHHCKIWVVLNLGRWSWLLTIIIIASSPSLMKYFSNFWRNTFRYCEKIQFEGCVQVGPQLLISLTIIIMISKYVCLYLMLNKWKLKNWLCADT